MASLDLAAILQNRQNALTKANTPVTTTVSLSQGLPSTNLNAVSTPPQKKIFSILSWNIRDYKGSKISSDALINQFVKIVCEKLKVDLLMIIETDVDLTEAVASIEAEPETGFGYLLITPPPKPKSAYDPLDDESTPRNDQYYDEVKKRAESLSDGDLLYWPFGSEMAFRKVNLPPTFDLSDLQKGILKTHPKQSEPWWLELEALDPIYSVTHKKTPITIQDCMKLAASKSSSGLKDFQFKLRTTCTVCNGLQKMQNVTEPCLLCRGTGVVIDFACETCGGAKTVFVKAPCPGCRGAREKEYVCGNCNATGQCGNCGGSGLVKCGTCGGPVPVACATCGGARQVNGLVCGACNGAGGCWRPKNCFACASKGCLNCGNCSGSKSCANCKGGGKVRFPCDDCGGAGEKVLKVDCASCEATGANPQYLCAACNHTGSTPCPSCAGPTCPKCTGTGRLQCVNCQGRGLTDPYCTRCGGSGLEDNCRFCAGTGARDPGAEDHALQTLRDLLTPTAFSAIDVETYTLLWRKGEIDLPPRVMGGLALASGDKAVWLDPNHAGLCSTDHNSAQLGYQDPSTKFNSRMPYVIPLYMDINGSKRQAVPIVLFHAIWGEVSKMKAKDKTDLVVDRAKSVLVLQNLGVHTNQGLIQVKNAPGSILVGDFNLDYEPGGVKRDPYNDTVQRAKKSTFTTLINDGYIIPVGGTQTGLTTKPVGINVLTGGKAAPKKKKDIHTYAYDNFLIKGADLQASIANCGVFNILGFIEDLLNNDQNLCNALDKEYGSPFVNNKVRAFYLYHDHISDHLPIILDLLVDEIDPQYKKELEEKKDYLLKFQPSTAKQRYLGEWKSLAEAIGEPAVSVGSDKLAKVRGKVCMTLYRSIVGVEAGGVVFFGKSGMTDVSSALIGKTAEGVFEIGEKVSLPLSDVRGTWLQVAKTDEKGFRSEGLQDGTEMMRGRLTWMDDQGNIAISLRTGTGKTDVMVIQGQGKLTGDPANMGDWVLALYKNG
jgi:hypothetical protein